MLNDLREAHVTELNRSINDRLRLPRRGFDEESGYLVLPEDWNDRQTSLEDIKTHLADTYGLVIESASTSGEAMINADELGTLEGIGRARTDKFSRVPIGLQQLATECKEFEGSGSIRCSPVSPNDPQGHQRQPVRVQDHRRRRRTGAPRSRVRTEVVQDLQRLANYESMLEEIEEIERISQTDGLESLADTGWNAGAPRARASRSISPERSPSTSSRKRPRPNPACPVSPSRIPR